MSTPDEFYRRFTTPEERKNRAASEWGGGFRWFASSNVVKLEDHRLSGEMADVLARLRQCRRDDMLAAVVKMLRTQEG
jgi:hypothetical protein